MVREIVTWQDLTLILSPGDTSLSHEVRYSLNIGSMLTEIHNDAFLVRVYQQNAGYSAAYRPIINNLSVSVLHSTSSQYHTTLPG